MPEYDSDNLNVSGTDMKTVKGTVREKVATWLTSVQLGFWVAMRFVT